MMKRLLSLASTLLALACAAPAMADDAPDALVKRVTEDVLQIVRGDKDIQSGNTQKAIALVEAKVLPHFNFNHMTALAMGRDWNKANPDQKKVLVTEFRTLLVRTYSNALTAYKNQTIEYKPFKMQPADTEVLVRTQVNQPGGKPVQIDYNLEKLDEGWKVFDVVVAGVSLVTNYRDTFTQEVRAGGVDGLIKSLQTKNKASEAKAAERK
ncbi:ABC transporter substrate-binding protein [Oryzomicrobium sp.]|uniref:MlaC/ttg2D family ABC transporter substrate-binding protein n=2 Tax=Oryzomicrobium sp. TaxID=1911578 RepID=UPI0025EBB2E0|nr:ABC transporter substrate-binding protein [Oryzomicrobium sp.]MCE1243911.1 ABC transporter substrate-binding protein [Oryzomicrobium sp.]